MHSRNKSYIYKALFEKKKDNFKSYSCLLFKILDNQWLKAAVFKIL